MSRKPSAQLAHLADRLSALPAFPSLPTDAWREVESATGWVLDSLEELCRDEEALDALFAYGLMLYERGDECGAEEVWGGLADRAAERGRADLAACCAARAGRCCADLNDLKLALSWCRRGKLWAWDLAPSHPAHALIDLNIGIIDHKRGDFQGAIRSMNRAAHGVPMDEKLTVRWAGRRPADFRALCLNALATVTFDAAQAGDPERREAILARAEAYLSESMQSADTESTKMLAWVNWAELLWLKGDVAASRTLTAALLQKTDPAEPTKEGFKPLLLNLLAVISLSEDDLTEAQRLARLSFESMASHRYPAWEQIMVRDLLRIFTRDHERRYGGHREDTVLRTLESSGAWLLPLLDYVENRDGYLSGRHGPAVATLSLSLLEEAGEEAAGPRPTAEADVSYLRGAALMHDIGKLEITWALLNRIRPPDAKSLRRLQGHVLSGSRMLEGMGFPMTARIVEEHHERADGGGYPFGNRDQTDFGAILALSEAVVSQSTPSQACPSPLDLDAAIERCLGEDAKGFQPHVLAALRKAREKGSLTRLQAVLARNS
jgi:HD-GYP domain-containing protein (c-di-GMP phosphodiesterase class II)